MAESHHRFHAVAVGPVGEVTASWGRRDLPVLLRSAAKPFQALPLVEDGVVTSLGLTEAELALCCASHNAEDAHIAAAMSILAKVGCSEEDLACGPHSPLLAGRERELLASGKELGPATSNCSGKHAGMLALAVHHGWRTHGYQRLDHPVQQRMLTEMSRWMELGRGEIAVATDGCGVPCFGVPLDVLAQGVARFARAAARGEGASVVTSAMTTHPFMVAGTRRLCTDLMKASEGRIFAKVGAEGVYVAGLPDQGLGVAVKVEDGAWRAAPPALVAVLEALDVLGAGVARALADYRSPRVVNTVGEQVGRIAVRL